MYKRIAITAWLIVFCMHFIAAQQPTMLTGLVLETNAKGTIEPVQGALVHWAGTSIGTATDSAGVFTIATHPTARLLVIQAIGYQTDTIVVAAKNFVKVMLINKTKLGEVTIAYERKATEINYLDPWKTQVMNEQELFKAACCNLSESFETNPSVDVSYTDALTGTKQIQLLGLATQYTQVTQEAIQGIRGLASVSGFVYTPGTWVKQIQLTKGVGSVVNGYESIAGQINVDLHAPTESEKLYLNGYASEGGRFETNIVLNNKVNSKFSQGVLMHASGYTLRMDRNEDGYLDNPLGSQYNLLYRFGYNNQKGWVLMGGARVLSDSKIGGQEQITQSVFDNPAPTLYGTQIVANRKEAWLKTGYVFPKKKYKSIGVQLQTVNQTYRSIFGLNRYNGNQQSGYSNLIYQTIIGSTNHKIRTGISNLYDYYDERFLNQQIPYTFNRTEWVTGAYLEYTYSYLALFTLVAGWRSDYHSLFGWQHVPRLHVRYALSEKTVLRGSAGKGWRTPNVLAENTGLMISSRTWNFTTTHLNNPLTLSPEIAWNYGLNLTHTFKLNYRPGTLSVDYYYTDFTKQFVIDRDANAQQVNVYALNGASYSNSLQAQLDYQPIRRFDVRMAYRWFDVRQQLNQGALQMPLIATHRAFGNLEYKTKTKWSFDATVQWTGAKRLPNTQSNPEGKRLNDYSQPFWIVNTQVTKGFASRWDVYLGIENVFNFKQPNAIVDSANPFGPYFDASMIWGPVFGRMVYVGFRFKR
jgi:outer membrane cobalamin receptor